MFKIIRGKKSGTFIVMERVLWLFWAVVMEQDRYGTEMARRFKNFDAARTYVLQREEYSC